MASFETAVEYVLAREGGWNEEESTNFGISLRFLRLLSDEKLHKYGIFEALTSKSVEELTREQAICIYRSEFWEGNQFDKINNQHVANYLFDCVVEHGIANAIRIAQHASWAIYRQKGYLKDDGILGKDTLDFINTLDNLILSVLIALRAAFCRQIVAQRPADHKYLEGWLNRCYWID